MALGQVPTIASFQPASERTGDCDLGNDADAKGHRSFNLPQKGQVIATAAN